MLTTRSLKSFLAIAFGLTWSITALMFFFPEEIKNVFGEVSMTNPLFVLAVYAPAIAAFSLVLYRAGFNGLKRFLSRLLLWRVSLIWYLFLLTGIPVLFYSGAALKGNLYEQPIEFSLVPLLTALATTAVIGPVEEFGWRGVALPLLQQRFVPFWSGLILGIIWGIWHIPAFVIGGTPQSGWSFAPFFIASVAVSLIVTPIFNASGGSILLPALFHFQLNNPIFPDAHPYDTIFFVAAAIIVVILNRNTMFTKEGAATEVIPCELGSIQFAYSNGQPEPYLDEFGDPIIGSISEKTFKTINGVKQGMFIKSKDEKHPVLLILHGGMPLYFLSQKNPTGLEDYFTVVWWEQRGSGISFDSNISTASITLEQMVADTLEVTNYLRNRFNKNKIYLMAHSGGSFIGIQAAKKAPEFFHAYIGVAQISNQLKSEQLAHEYMLKEYKLIGNKKMVRKLENAPVTDITPDKYLKLRDKAMHSLGIGTTHNMKSVITGIFIPSLLCRDYTLREKYNFWAGKSHSGVHSLWSEVLSTNLMIEVPKLEIPVYFFGGVYDYTVSSTLAKEYLRELQAPVKGFYTFKESAHSPIFEEPEKVKEIMLKDVLNGTADLAD